jgi:RNA polymerase sigma-70 factor (sigma-E family)
MSMGTNSKPVTLPAGPAPARRPADRHHDVDGAAQDRATEAAAAVSALYRTNALGLVRLAHVLIGDRAAAEDIVQDAFSGLYRRWEHLTDPGKALPYVRSSVLNSCRSMRRSRWRAELMGDSADLGPVLASAEAVVLSEEQRQRVMAALRGLPSRQREVLVLRFYLELTEAEIAAEMGIGQSSVRSAQARALAALGRMLKEAS